MWKKYFQTDIIIILSIITLLSLTSCHKMKEKFIQHHNKETMIIKTIDKISNHLELDSMQIKQLDRVKEELPNKIKAIKETKKNSINEIKFLIEKENVSNTDIQKILIKPEEKMKELKEYFTNELALFINSLSQKQRQILTEYLNKHSKHFDN